MVLADLSLINFKNYSEASLDFDSNVNIFTGLNGQGKTNLLDAIHYLSTCKSYFNPIDSQNIHHGEDFFVVEGVFQNGEGSDKIYCGVKRGQKKVFRKNKTDYERLAEHVGQFPAVVISPYDKDLISEGSEVRRRFTDSIISQYNRRYLDHLIDYNKILKQRNSLLKYFWENRTFDADNLEVWSMQLCDLAEKIFAERQQFIAEFTPVFLAHYNAISGGGEEVGVRYRSDLDGGDFAETLAQSLEKDRRTSYTNVGIHKDDLRLTIDGHPLKKFGSQGQQKTFLIALKLAQFDLVKQATGRMPVLLLDDIFDKIDDVRVQHLMHLVNDHNFGQIFITDTHAGRVREIFSGIARSVKVFDVKKGEVHEAQGQ
ncbi:MAG: DNA replication/repair protein RecF [Cryomorphaceae bacterium]|nr:DNA replication/repair protein RecF [Flavobacteriales bacterium]